MATMKTLNGYGFDSAKLGGRAPEYYTNPRNLLDNSDFRNPVNQRGQTSYTAYGYTIDRWKNSHSFQVSVNAGSITVAGTKFYNHFMQAIEKYSFLVGKTVTLAIRCKGASGGTAGLAMIDSSDTIYGNTQHTLTGGWQTIVETVTIPGEISTTSLWFSVYTASALDMEWAALYEGSYTAETLPPYVPKGYAAELEECRRYFRRYTAKDASLILSGLVTSGSKDICVHAPELTPMRTKNVSIAYSGSGVIIRGVSGYATECSNSNIYGNISVSPYQNNSSFCATIDINKKDGTAWGLTNNTPVVVQFSANDTLDYIADL